MQATSSTCRLCNTAFEKSSTNLSHEAQAGCARISTLSSGFKMPNECSEKCMHWEPVMRAVLLECGTPPAAPFAILAGKLGTRTSFGRSLLARMLAFNLFKSRPILQRM